MRNNTPSSKKYRQEIQPIYYFRCSCPAVCYWRRRRPVLGYPRRSRRWLPHLCAGGLANLTIRAIFVLHHSYKSFKSEFFDIFCLLWTPFNVIGTLWRFWDPQNSKMFFGKCNVFTWYHLPNANLDNTEGQPVYTYSSMALYKGPV